MNSPRRAGLARRTSTRVRLIHNLHSARHKELREGFDEFARKLRMRRMSDLDYLAEIGFVD